MNEMKERIRSMWRDDRKYLNRLFEIIPLSFSLFFMIVFYGPLDILLWNQYDADINYLLVAIPLGAITILGTIASAMVIALLKGVIFDTVNVFFLSLLISAYIQGTFLNIDLGDLRGDSIAWQLYSTHSVVNLIVWIAIFAACKIIYSLFTKQYKKIVLFLCFMLFGMQLCGGAATLINYYSTQSGAEEEEKQLILSGKDQYVMSNEENVIIFVLDDFPNRTLRNIISSIDEDILEKYADFTWFDNCNMEYKSTYPGMIHLLTGYEYDYKEETEANIENAWQADLTKNIYGTLSDAGYETNLYMVGPRYVCGLDIERIADTFSNVVPDEGEETVITKGLINQFLRLSLYRYVPHALKASFWTSTGEVGTQIAAAKTARPIETSYDFCGTVLSGDALKKQAINKQVKIHLLKGAHSEYLVDRNGNYVPEGTDKNEQACGYLTVVAEYMDQLRELGLYDNSTIVVTTDHGTNVHPQGIFLIKRKGETHEETQINHATISQGDVMMTVLDALGLDYSDFGVSAFDREEDDKLIRHVYFWRKDESLPDLGKEYNAVYLYSYMGDGAEIDRMIADEEPPTKIIPLVDSFY